MARIRTERARRRRSKAQRAVIETNAAITVQRHIENRERLLERLSAYTTVRVRLAADKGPSLAGAASIGGRRSQGSEWMVYKTWNQPWKPTIVQTSSRADLGMALSMELENETARFASICRAGGHRIMRIVHSMNDPLNTMKWTAAPPGGLGAVCLGDTEEWHRRQEQVIESKASRAGKEARRGLRGEEAAEAERRAYEATAAKFQGWAEWLCAREMELHFRLSDGPVVLSRGSAPWVAVEHGAIQSFALPDMRILFDKHDRARVALRGVEEAFTSYERLCELRLNDDFTFGSAMDAYSTPTQHSVKFMHFHDWAACHGLNVATSAVIASKSKRTLALRFRAPDGGPAFRAVFDGIVAMCLPLVWAAFEKYVPWRYWAQHKACTEIYNSGFTYFGWNSFMDGTFADKAPGFVDPAWFDGDSKLSHGLNYHGDHGNAVFRMGAIVVLGKFEYFHQHYPAFNCTLLTQHFCLLIGDYAMLWHAVGPGSGFRFSITLFDHEVTVTGVRRQDGYVVDWDEIVDPRSDEERYEPDIDALVEAAYQRVLGGCAFSAQGSDDCEACAERVHTRTRLACVSCRRVWHPFCMGLADRGEGKARADWMCPECERTPTSKKRRAAERSGGGHYGLRGDPRA